jgi:hypothetical protein
MRKHPDVDHAAIRDRLAAAAASIGGRSRTVGCLGACGMSNVVVVKVAHAGTFWTGEVLGDWIVDALDSWIRQGAPLPVPADVDARVFDRLAPSPGDVATTPPALVSLQRSRSA